MTKCKLCLKKNASFNYIGLKRLYCGDCKLSDMVNVKNDKCIICRLKTASFNYVGLNTKYCMDCKLDNMINVRNRTCVTCKKESAKYNYVGLKPDYCECCKLIDMISVKYKNCKSCKKKQACFNYINLKPYFCSDCKKEDMVDVKNKRCEKCKTKSALFNFENMGVKFCFTCKEEGMVDVFSKKCFCGKACPYFNFKGMRPAYCSDCKTENMINVKNKLCIVCKKIQASCNYKGLSRKYCSGCKLENMINVLAKECEFCEINSMSKNYSPNCLICFSFLNPNSELIRNYKTKEKIIMAFVKEKYKNCILDSIIKGGCSKRRPDGLIEFNSFSLIIEIDENSHSHYEEICENKRIMEIYNDLGNRPLRVIRFNPDSYTDINNKKIDSLFSKDQKTKKLKVKYKKDLNLRVFKLMECISETIENINMNFEEDGHIKSIDIKYLFFDNYKYE